MPRRRGCPGGLTEHRKMRARQARRAQGSQAGRARGLRDVRGPRELSGVPNLAFREFSGGQGGHGGPSQPGGASARTPRPASSRSLAGVGIGGDIGPRSVFFLVVHTSVRMQRISFSFPSPRMHAPPRTCVCVCVCVCVSRVRSGRSGRPGGLWRGVRVIRSLLFAPSLSASSQLAAAPPPPSRMRAAWHALRLSGIKK